MGPLQIGRTATRGRAGKHRVNPLTWQETTFTLGRIDTPWCHPVRAAKETLTVTITAMHRITVERALALGACRTLGVESENRPQCGQFSPTLQCP